MLIDIGNFDLTIEEQKIRSLIIKNKIKLINIVTFSDKLFYNCVLIAEKQLFK